MSFRDDIPLEERAAYDAAYAASLAGKVEELDREWVNVKQAVYDALPRRIRWLFVWLIEERRS